MHDDLRDRFRGQPVAHKEPAASHQPAPVKNISAKNKRLKPMVGVLLALLLVALTSAWYFTVRSNEPIPQEIKKSVHFALYYPNAKTLPQNLSVDKTSFQSPSQGVVTYKINGSSGTKYYVSQQALPTNFDFAKFKNKFEKTDDFVTSYGSGFVGDLGNQLVASIQTNQNAWIIVNTSDYTKQAELESLCRSLSPLK